MKGNCNKSLKILYNLGIEDYLRDDDFEGSKKEDSIFRDVFFGLESDKTSKKCLVTGAINFENEHKKPKDTSFGSNSDNSVISSQTDVQNIKESEDFTILARNDPNVEVKRRKVVLEEHLNTKTYLEKVINSSLPSKETDSCLIQSAPVVTCRLVESSTQGFKSSCYLLKGAIGEIKDHKETLTCKIKTTTSDENDQKEKDVNAPIASPVSQESHVSKLLVTKPDPIQFSKRKWKDSSFVELEEDEIALPPKDSTSDPKPILRFHINRLLRAAKWIIGRRNRTTHCKGHGEYVFKSPEGRPIREFHRAWNMCGQKLITEASYVISDSNGIEWTSLTEFLTDFSNTLTEIEEQLRNLEGATALAHWWYLLDPFAKVGFIDKSLRNLKEGKQVKTKRSVIDGFYLSDEAVLPLKKEAFNENQIIKKNPEFSMIISSKSDIVSVSCETSNVVHPVSGGSESVSPHLNGTELCSPLDADVDANENKKSKKISELQNGFRKKSTFKKSVKRRGIFKKSSKKGKKCQLEDDDLLLSAILKNRPCIKKKPLVPKLPKKYKKGRKPKGGCRLRPRSNHIEGKWSGLGVRTVLSWLIDFGVIKINEIIQYRNPKNDLVIKDGSVTRDGILCRCCEKMLSVSEFKNHAGYNLKSPCLNLFMESGKPFTLCQLEAWSAEYKVRRGATRTVEVEEIDENDDSCGLCGDGGELVCCDNCPSTFHLTCLCIQELPEGNWYCARCSCWICGNLVDDNEASNLVSLKCLQCEHKYHEECVKEKGMEIDLASSTTWLCGESCKEVYTGLQSQIGIMNPISDNYSWTLLKCIHGDQKVHSPHRLMALKAECNLKLAVALTIMEECFLPMVDPRTGIDMIPHVVYNWGSEFARLSYEGFYTLILEKDDVILCVASVRIHGAKVAEMPLIATCSKYRRKGMCRRLMDAIEEMLKSFKVEKLVVSAIPSLVDTWTEGFGFTHLEPNEKKTLTKTNLMVFPGTVWLKKPMYQGIIITPTEEAQPENNSCEEPQPEPPLKDEEEEGKLINTGLEEVNP